MINKNSSPAPTINEPLETFNFSDTKAEIRTMLIDGEPYFVATDIAVALGYANPHDAIKRHCRYLVKREVPHPQNSAKQIRINVIPEGDVYRLIFHSELPSAKKFESWIMDEVLPALRKKGYYKIGKLKDDFIDARDIPFQRELINGYAVATITINEKLWSIVDLAASIPAKTEAAQIAKKLNIKRTLAWKVWLFGVTNPAWFTNETGKQLMLSGSRINLATKQLSLPFRTGGAA